MPRNSSLPASCDGSIRSDRQVEYRFVVPGRPRPVGSYLFVARSGKVCVVSHHKARKWQKAVKLAAMVASGGPCASARPVAVFATFQFRLPKSRKSGERFVSSPDVDKLLRALLDSLTGVFYPDDRYVVEVSARKCYGPEDLTEVVVRYL